MTRFLPLLAFLASFVTVNAQPVATLQPVRGVERLPVLSVHRLMQDTEGYIWYGTVDGLCRDDGYDVRVFRNDFLHPTPLRSNLILCICEDSLHRIVFGTPSSAFYLDKADYQVRPFCPDTLADNMNMSRSTLVRKLKAITGQTPLQFVRDIKMVEAQKMLTQHTASVFDVARRLGYSDREHFARVFREVTGQLPSEVRRNTEMGNE